MLQVKHEVDWGESSSEKDDSETISAEIATEDNNDVLAALDVAGNLEKDNMTTHIVADLSCASQPSNTSRNETLPEKRILNIKSAKGSVGFVSGNPRLVRGNKSFQSVATSKPPAMAPPPPPRANRGHDKMNQQATRKFDNSFAWHFGGRRVWSWMHDGVTPNGWIELCENGHLCTDLCSSGEGSWK